MSRGWDIVRMAVPEPGDICPEQGVSTRVEGAVKFSLKCGTYVPVSGDVCPGAIAGGWARVWRMPPGAEHLEDAETRRMLERSA